MRHLDCLIISTGRAASTAVYSYLNERGDLDLPVNKEPHHWCDIKAYKGRYKLLNDLYVPDGAKYEALYDGSVRMIDASVGYFFTIDEVISRLERAGQRPKVLFLYREPVSRAASLFNELRKKGLESSGALAHALRKRNSAGLWWEHYYDNVHYARVYKALTTYFPSIMTVNYRAFAAQPREVMDQIMRFLDIETVREISYEPVNSSAEAILTRKAMPLRGVFRHVPAGLRRRLVSAYGVLYKRWAYCDVATESEFPLSVAEYKSFRKLIDDRDIFYASGS